MSSFAPIGSVYYQLGELALGVVEHGRDPVTQAWIAGGGVEWACDVEGWWDTPDVVGDPVPYSDEDGAEPVPGYFASKPLTLTGMCVAPREVDAVQAEARLKQVAALMPRTSQQLVVHSAHDLSQLAEVRLAGPARFQWVSPRAFRFQLPLRADDPYRYSYRTWEGAVGPEVVHMAADNLAAVADNARRYPRAYPWGYFMPAPEDSYGHVSVYNRGSARTHPVLRVHSGRIVTPRIVLAPDAEIAVDRTLTAEDELLIDTRTRTVLLNGLPASRWLLTPPTGRWELPPGRSTVRFYGIDADAAVRLTITYRHAWL